jgi:hypothetical protein
VTLSLFFEGAKSMADVPPVADLVQKIEAHDASATAAVAALEDRCLVDGRNRSLFDVAILADNAEVIALLASDPAALVFSAPVDAKRRDLVKHAVAMNAVEVPISKLETFLEEGFGKDLAYGRTPLHTACRAGNANVIGTLLGAGATSGDKDAIGLTAPELAFFAHGEAGLRDFLTAFERSGQTKLPVGKRLLEETLPFPETMAQLLRVAKLDAAARNLLFCYRCAWLDADAVRAMLADGQNPNKGITAELNPLWEVCTSAMLWNDAIPGGLEMAFHYTKFQGHPGASAVSFDNALLNEDGSNFGKLFAEAERKRKALVKSVEAMTIEPDAERELIARRIALLDVLFDAGADFALARKKQHLVTFGELKQMKLGEVAQHLEQRGGGGAAPKKKARKPAATTFWDLVGETGLNLEYWPEEGGGGCIRLVLHDGYGPVDGVTLSVRLSRGKARPTGKWRALKPLTETLGVEGERVPRAELSEPVYGEAPWEAVYELSLEKASGANVLWIRFDHPEEERLRGKLGPWKFSKG